MSHVQCSVKTSGSRCQWRCPLTGSYIRGMLQTIQLNAKLSTAMIIWPLTLYSCAHKTSNGQCLHADKRTHTHRMTKFRSSLTTARQRVTMIRMIRGWTENWITTTTDNKRGCEITGVNVRTLSMLQSCLSLSVWYISEKQFSPFSSVHRQTEMSSK